MPLNNRTDCGAYAYDYNFWMLQCDSCIMGWQFDMEVLVTEPFLGSQPTYNVKHQTWHEAKVILRLTAFM